MELKPRQLEILEAAGAILYEEGIGGLTTKSIAKRVGFTESALYRHYASKEEILAALLQYLYASMEERLPPIAAMSEVAPSERLRRLFGSQLEYLAEHPHFLVAIFSDGLLKYSPAIKADMLRIMFLMRSAVLRVIEDGQEDKVFIEHIPAEELTHILMGSFRLLMLQWRIENFKFDVKIAENQHIENLISLISRR
ncbi:MAG: TetR/AcrR family transcriptional regulator [Saprospiraceae bacterium]|nr:TetR/AcrR family transcriptional regulator [Saprospiraceae bacterium]